MAFVTGQLTGKQALILPCALGFIHNHRLSDDVFSKTEGSWPKPVSFEAQT